MEVDDEASFPTVRWLADDDAVPFSKRKVVFGK